MFQEISTWSTDGSTRYYGLIFLLVFTRLQVHLH